MRRPTTSELLDQGSRIITGREVEKRGMEDCVTEALELAGNGTDLIYVSVDIDCLAYPFTIGTSAATPEGLSAWQLLEGMWLCGQHPKVGGAGRGRDRSRRATSRI